MLDSVRFNGQGENAFVQMVEAAGSRAALTLKVPDDGPGLGRDGGICRLLALERTRARVHTHTHTHYACVRSCSVTKLHIATGPLPQNVEVVNGGGSFTAVNPSDVAFLLVSGQAPPINAAGRHPFRPPHVHMNGKKRAAFNPLGWITDSLPCPNCYVQVSGSTFKGNTLGAVGGSYTDQASLSKNVFADQTGSGLRARASLRKPFWREAAAWAR